MGLALIAKILVIVALYVVLVGQIEKRCKRQSSSRGATRVNETSRASRRGGRVA